MEFTRSIFISTALALAFGSAQATDSKQARELPRFNEMDKDDDGALTRSEAAGNPALLARFKDVDDDRNDKISRFEYLRVMAVKDVTTLRESIAEFIEPDENSAASGSTKEGR